MEGDAALGASGKAELAVSRRFRLVRPWVEVNIAIMLAACGGSAPGEPAVETQPAAAEPASAVRPVAGEHGDRGAGEPALEIRSEPSSHPTIDAPRSSGPYLAEPTLTTAHPEPMPNMPALVEVTLRGRLANPPMQAGRELEFDLACEVADPKDEAAAIVWGALVQFDPAEPKAFAVTRATKRRAFEFCAVETVHRRRCAVEDMRRNDCDETDAVSLPALCFVPAGEAWTLRPQAACTPKWKHTGARERPVEGARERSRLPSTASQP